MDNSIRRVLLSLLLLLFGEWVGWLTKDTQRKKGRGEGGGEESKRNNTPGISLLQSFRQVVTSHFPATLIASQQKQRRIFQQVFLFLFFLGLAGGVRGYNVSYNIRKGEELGLCMFTSDP